VRDPEVWRRTKEGARKAGSYGFDLLLQLGKYEAKRFASEKLGISL
jgi:hypothetical protein